MSNVIELARFRGTKVRITTKTLDLLSRWKWAVGFAVAIAVHAPLAYLFWRMPP